MTERRSCLAHSLLFLVKFKIIPSHQPLFHPSSQVDNHFFSYYYCHISICTYLYIIEPGGSALVVGVYMVSGPTFSVVSPIRGLCSGRGWLRTLVTCSSLSRVSSLQWVFLLPCQLMWSQCRSCFCNHFWGRQSHGKLPGILALTSFCPLFLDIPQVIEAGAMLQMYYPGWGSPQSIELCIKSSCGFL